MVEAHRLESSMASDDGGGSSFMDDKVMQASVALAIVAVLAGSAYFFLVLRKKSVLDPEEWRNFKVTKRIQVSHNVVKLRFGLPTPTSVLGLPIGQHISCRGTDTEGEEVIKPYTPTTLDSDVGYFELVAKVYTKGRMSGYLGRMKVGDVLQARGPKGRFRYIPNQVRAFGMLAGGTGLTPMFQVTRAILENPKDRTKVHLIYANVTFDDILLKEELDTFAKIYPDRFKIYYVLNEGPKYLDVCKLRLSYQGTYQTDRHQPPEGWEGGVGFVSRNMIETHLPPPADDVKILRCGPPAMNKAMVGHTDAIGYTKEMQFQF